MIDIHCHVLPQVDDGSKSLNETIAILKKAEAAGITDIIFTPHYVAKSKYTFDHQSRSKILEIVKETALRNKININLYLGSEIWVDKDLTKNVYAQKVTTLNNSRYVLVELPVHIEDQSAKQAIFELVTNGFVPVLAHPERYDYFQRNINLIIDYINLGCIMQGDYQSLHGKYGKAAQKTLKTYIKKGLIHLLASDIHHSKDDYNIPETYKKLRKMSKDRNLANRLLVENPKKILEDRPLEIAK